MTEISFRRIAGVVLSCLFVAGCADDGEPDPCRGPYPVHPGDSGPVSTLDLDFGPSGTLNGVFRPEPGALGSGTEQLAAEGGIFDLGDRPDCRTRYDATGEDGEWSFEVDCGGEAVMKSFEVTVFETLTDLDEVIVEVSTPATSKTFAILRACEAPVYRIR